MRKAYELIGKNEDFVCPWGKECPALNDNYVDSKGARKEDGGDNPIPNATGRAQAEAHIKYAYNMTRIKILAVAAKRKTPFNNKIQGQNDKDFDAIAATLHPSSTDTTRLIVF